MITMDFCTSKMLKAFWLTLVGFYLDVSAVAPGPAIYTQFIVYHLDSDGIAEFACKTAMVPSMAKAT